MDGPMLTMPCAVTFIFMFDPMPDRDIIIGRDIYRYAIKYQSADDPMPRSLVLGTVWVGDGECTSTTEKLSLAWQRATKTMDDRLAEFTEVGVNYSMAIREDPDSPKLTRALADAVSRAVGLDVIIEAIDKLAEGRERVW